MNNSSSFNNEGNEFRFDGHLYKFDEYSIRNIYGIKTKKQREVEDSDQSRFKSLRNGQCYVKLLTHHLESVVRVERMGLLDRCRRYYIYDNVEVVWAEMMGKVVSIAQKYRPLLPYTESNVFIRFHIDDGTSDQEMEIFYAHVPSKPLHLKLGQFIRVWGHIELRKGTNNTSSAAGSNSIPIQFNALKILIPDQSDEQTKVLPLYLWLQCRYLHESLYKPCSRYIAKRKEVELQQKEQLEQERKKRIRFTNLLNDNVDQQDYQQDQLEDSQEEEDVDKEDEEDVDEEEEEEDETKQQKDEKEVEDDDDNEEYRHYNKKQPTTTSSSSTSISSTTNNNNNNRYFDRSIVHPSIRPPIILSSSSGRKRETKKERKR
ncbi:hypothetical protein DFA_10187 [Cavenderia fasciculata]|uniref:Uncharacterized protein n=1 Tax=Cavenderia fasciculata TaxID=261658 RepID=F4Q9I4_CACFS|nr:uncharacterized protein DFA_10187 [Cavenderia fasciculata]EGG15353.1 hypothetical protein DFA_10187 [Cavenderia fasciculata]|eukprot:XP_004354095.1 hypothetical protein DFA_10187 [Cavenderia fasciculata]